MLFVPFAIIALSLNSVLAVFAGPNDPRIEKWNRMKIALPDGILPEEPTMDIHAAMRPPINREQYNEGLGYKHSALPHRLKLVAPLPLSSSSVQQQAVQLNDANKAHYKLAVSNAFKGAIQAKRVVGLDDQGKLQYINLPDYHRG
ncbi:hypothetical protein G6F56_007023 [Rhizopus delemar]|nr:hypothetical protein G6F56_007023 [Rhizopus delemar]